MNQRELKSWLSQFMAHGIRTKSKVLTTGDIGSKAKQSDVAKARALMEIEATRYDKKQIIRRRPAVESKPEPQGSAEGPDGLSEDRKGADQGR